MTRVTHDERANPVFEEKRGIDLLKKKKEEAVLPHFLCILQLHTAKNVRSIALKKRETQDHLSM